MRRRHPLLKALGGVVLLLAVGGVTGYAGVRVVQNMVNNNGESRLARFTDGSDHPTIVTLGDPTAKIKVALPAPLVPSLHETLTFLGSVQQVDRVISPAGDDSVQILWFRVAPTLALNPAATLRILAASQAADLGGTQPVDATLVSTGTTAAYEFEVQPKSSTATATATVTSYYVRILMHGNVVYVIRVEAATGGAAALAKVVKSIAWVKPAAARS
ncbi:MAG TPA: hypothetical protein VGO03_09835 [Acidimicrobiia bacterium]|jgi:hypothetical protein